MREIHPEVLRIYSVLTRICVLICSGDYENLHHFPLSETEIVGIIDEVRRWFPFSGIMYAPVPSYEVAHQYLEELVSMDVGLIVSVGSGNAIVEAVLLIVAFCKGISMRIVCSDPSSDLPDMPALPVERTSAKETIKKYCNVPGAMVLAVYPPLTDQLTKAGLKPTNIASTCKNMKLPLTVVGAPYPPRRGGNVGEDNLWIVLEKRFEEACRIEKINGLPNPLELDDAIVIHVPVKIAPVK